MNDFALKSCCKQTTCTMVKYVNMSNSGLIAGFLEDTLLLVM